MKDEMKRNAKKSMLKTLSDEMRGMMGDSRGKSLKKVTVAAPDSEGLEKGLSKAKELIEDEDESEEMGESEESDEMEGMSEDSDEECSKEELEAKIQKLQEKLNSLK